LCGDYFEFGIQVGADTVNDGDNRNGNTGGDKTVFDRYGSQVILYEAHKQVLHWISSDQRSVVWANLSGPQIAVIFRT
jgi:hypothetical protein